MTIDQPTLPGLAEQNATVDLVGNDPRHDDDYNAFIATCRFIARPNGLVSINAVRSELSNVWGLTIEPRRYSAFWRRARLDGHLERTGEWERNTDAKGRNAGKPQPVYRWVGGAS